MIRDGFGIPLISEYYDGSVLIQAKEIEQGIVQITYIEDVHDALSSVQTMKIDVLDVDTLIKVLKQLQGAE